MINTKINPNPHLGSMYFKIPLANYALHLLSFSKFKIKIRLKYVPVKLMT